MKLSSRGSLRKGANAISWVVSLLKLAKAAAVDPAAALRKWNDESVVSDRVAGPKANSVKHVLELNEDARSVILMSVSELTWEGRSPSSCLCAVGPLRLLVPSQNIGDPPALDSMFILIV